MNAFGISLAYKTVNPTYEIIGRIFLIYIRSINED